MRGDFSHSDFSKYASSDEIYEIIEKIDKKKLATFSEVEKIKVASFYLNYSKDINMHVTELQAKKLVDEWEQK